MSWKLSIVILGAASLAGVGTTPGCRTAPKSRAQKASLIQEADSTLASMRSDSRRLDALLQQAVGYVVFPRIGKGGILIGGASGRGVVYEGGEPIGFVRLDQASIGAQLGGQSFSEIIIFETQGDLEELKDGRFSLGASVSAVALTAGAGQALEFQDGVAVAIMPRGGLMVDMSVSGQRLNFEGRRPIPRG